MMPPHPFFPTPEFAWVFYLVLVGLTATAAVIDLRKMSIPKSITLTMLAVGVLFNVTRTAWLAASLPEGESGSLWFGNHGPWIGALEGLLFSLLGFAVAFAGFFLMWILGTCGGGDVKLFAALGACVGWLLTLWLLLGTMTFVVVLGMGKMAYKILRGGMKQAMQDYSIKKNPKSTRKNPLATPKRRLLTYSLPVALSTALLLLWAFRVELGLMPPRPPRSQSSIAQVSSAARVPSTQPAETNR